MKCYICNNEFYSFEWHREDSNTPVCDNCLLEILKGRKRVQENALKDTCKKINELSDKIKEMKVDV